MDNDKDQELRDFFAAMALCGMLACPNNDNTAKDMTESAYYYADTMMEARSSDDSH